tara:strand:+ start:40638 stop:41288 length:651 start_codon:yes stop_codon:yes gene_type:complete
MQEYKIEVEKRELSSKKSFVKELRSNGHIPGVYYSHDSKESIPFMVTLKNLREALKSDSQVYKINVGGKTRDVIMKTIQYHPITEQILHIDLYGVKMDAKVTVKIPIMFTGQSIGVKEGGVLNQSLTELDIACLPANIPQDIEIDISNLNLGDTLRIEDINLADDLEIVGDSSMLIASVVAPAKQEETTDEDSLEGTETEDLAADDSSEKSESDSE